MSTLIIGAHVKLTGQISHAPVVPFGLSQCPHCQTYLTLPGLGGPRTGPEHGYGQEGLPYEGW